ncbi:MAG: 30S ribosomal protein S5 [Clostridia bacterium]|jgi:small subunit ribosomal protein S5|nr:30S ribosomal protein S5 [Clostridia bacterium]MCI9459556.1 30S ribosomal protein S5 [Clostridia bacterium]
MAREDFKKKRDKDVVDDGIKTKLVETRRVCKVVKGGRNSSFAALVVAGDGKGKVGIGMGKATEVPEAIKKAEQAARRNMRAISLNGTSIPHEAMGKFSCSKVLLRPAPEGRGVIAGGSVRAVLELCGINNITTKCYGSRNPINVVKATMNALSTLRTADEVAAIRGKSVSDL